uniref:Uncharacterized protein n=1 Tax=Anguilla anguilla TaxID=7936 RepID=A0A0E9SNP1_ANGAN
MTLSFIWNSQKGKSD